MAQIIPWVVLFLPLLAAVAIQLFLQAQRDLAARLSIGAILAAFGLSCLLFISKEGADQVFESTVNWLSVGALVVDFGLRVDRLSLLMLLIVSAVGGAIHLYSYGYMREDRDFSRYFACLSFFTFSMLGVVLANNFVMMFVFWELVGVSSYLLIGFWYERPAAADAGKKAFLANRLGDAGFLAGILLLWATLGSVHFGTLQQKFTENPNVLGALSTLAGLLIFCGAVGKSAQFPLHVWLPDAMEGPTPVSALIHAATMVAAGVFMLCRVFFVFSGSALDIIAWTGLITALLAAIIAIQQNDIKRILAYSTLSQLGYMVLAVGLGGRSQAMFHLTTHACFKALLFLGAGSIIYALHHEQDIWKMGALRRRMPTTYWTFLAATLALCGMPPFSGFFSKDSILALAGEQHKLFFVLALGCSALTTFYMFRLVYVVFLGPEKSSAAGNAQESPAIIIQPLMFLAVPTVFLGFWGVEHYLGGFFGESSAEAAAPWYQQVFLPFAHAPLAAFAGLGALGFGFFAASELYRTAKRDPLPEKLGHLAGWMRDRFYIDEFYSATVIAAQERIACLADGFDRWIIAGVVVRGLHGTTELTGRLLRLMQTGNLQTYALFFVIGIVLLMYLALDR